MDLIINEELRRRCLNIARRIVNNRDDAEDVCQDTFMRAIDAIEKDKYRGDSEEMLERYIFRILRRRALDLLRHRNRRPKTEELAEELEDRNNFLAEIVLSVTIADALKRLKPRHYARLIVMVDIEQRTIPDVAETLESTEGAVKSMLHRSRAALRILLSK